MTRSFCTRRKAEYTRYFAPSMIAPAAETDRSQWILQGLAITPERPTKRFGTSLILFVAFILKQAFSDTGVYWKGPTVVANEHFLLCPRISFSEVVNDDDKGDKKSLLGASLACKALCPRTRVHLFSVVVLSGKPACDRLHELIALSPKLTLHFRTLYIALMNVQDIHAPAVYGVLTVIESLVNVTDLSLLAGRLAPCTRHRCIESPIPFLPQPRGNHVLQAQVDRRDLLAFEELARLAIRDVRLQNCFGGVRGTVSQHLHQYLALPTTALKHLYVTHNILGIGILGASSRTLNVSGVENIAATITMTPTVHWHLVFQVFEWWISNFSAVNKDCAIRCITFKVTLDLNQPPSQGEHPALKWEDLWKRLDDCLASYKMALLKRFSITFEPRPPEWDLMRAQMENNFPGLKRLGRELVLEAQVYDEMGWVNRY
ncbi:hypothetical protein EV421DRAFT_2000681 [Armillaria borealis]|uniref:Uncharacterized protein n=1 Tax=Armillaria borealis TaxID=47425 RepID=A0AA39IXW8_9AGAR|nr:hypothetical protein EV421DRAFT_2000681 [Armillaria borealis]